MKCVNLYLLFILILLAGSADAQTRRDRVIRFNGSAEFLPPANLSKNDITALNKSLANRKGRNFIVVQFDRIPDQQQRIKLEREGIRLLEFVDNGAFTALLEKPLTQSTLQTAGVISIFEPSAALKIDAELARGIIEPHARKVDGMVDVWLNFVNTYQLDEVKILLLNRNYLIISDILQDYQILTVRVPQAEILELAEEPYVQHIRAIPGEDQPINDKSRANGRANVLNSSLGSGRNLKGAGITIGVGDDSNPLRHVDFNPRIINNSTATAGTHGIHVMGTVGGAGIQREQYAGYAPKSTMISQYFSYIWINAATYVKDYGMVLTNNSYGSGDDANCSTFGVYDITSNILDQQAILLPNLQQVFAAGNSGVSLCSPYPSGYANILGGYQTAKNVITVGNTSSTGTLASGSSRGPVKDGRIKPEIVAQGSSVISTYPGDLYGSNSGTSMASPAVTGGLALLYERYKQLHSGQNPRNGLMKALICNGATDLGNPGPDYQFGFGWMNLLRSVKMLEANAYKNDSLQNLETKSFDISIPANTARLKVMLYWNDPAASVLASKSLVNDLDLKVKSPANDTIRPLVLQTIGSSVNINAAQGEDHVNNIEQVVIENPAVGDYSILVKGSSIIQNPLQPYFVVYDIIPASLTLTNPLGGETVAPGEAFVVSWDSFGNSTSTFNVQYSADNGANWTNIVTNMAASVRQVSWTVPNLSSGTVKIKVIQNLTGQEVASEAFTVIGLPVLTESPIQCESYFAFQWTPVSGATDYEVMMSNGLEMVSKGIVTGTSYVLGGLSKDSTYYVSVRCRVNGKPGRRGHALKRKPDTGTCEGSISDNDLKIDTIVSPVGNGRKFTSTELLASQPVTVRIKNLDDAASSQPFIINYSINNTVIYSQTINPSIAPGGTYDHTFPVNFNFSNVGNYPLKVIVTRSGDPFVTNNVLSKTFRQLSNNVMNVPVNEGFETLSNQSIMKAAAGLSGGDRYDFISSSATGRLRTFMNSGLAYSGTRAITMDVGQFTGELTTNYLIGTYNLSNYQVANHDIRLDFKYKNHGQEANDANKVWIRGSDTNDWIQAYDLFGNQLGKEQGYQSASAIEITRLLTENSQEFSSSFQLRFGQAGRNLASDYFQEDGYTFDNIQLYTTQDDIQLLSLDTPGLETCNYSASETVKVTIRNSSPGEVFNVPVKLKVDGNAEITETISSIPGQTNISYTFGHTANLTGSGWHTIKVSVDLMTDDYPANDIITESFFNAPAIASLPYYQDFESGDGYWHTRGTNSSWQYGTPNSGKINSAASGTKAWKTNLTGPYNSSEMSYLYSPCFQVAGVSNPTLSFSLSLNLEVCDSIPCDIGYVEYSGDGGEWTVLGNTGEGTNWYNGSFQSLPFWSAEHYNHWHVATSALPAGFTTLRLRFVMKSDAYTVLEGIAIDDIHIYDKSRSIYDEGTTSAVSQNVPASSDWIHFTSNNKLVASVKSGTQNLGETAVQAFVYSGNVRTGNEQYYLNRNLIIKPTNKVLTDSVTIRLYFLDSEMEAVLQATTCANCEKPESAYVMGVSKFSANDVVMEDGDVSNNSSGTWFLKADAKKVPFDKGYYAEFKVKDFSEFWFANDNLNEAPPLPVTLSEFTVRKQDSESGTEVILAWKTTSEVNAAHFDVEVASGDEHLQHKLFTKIGEVTAEGRAHGSAVYHFVDTEPAKTGNRYYRLKMVDRDGSFAYSAIRSVEFDDLLAGYTYPNPSSGTFFFDFNTVAGLPVSIKVVESSGRVLKQEETTGNGTLQSFQADISGKAFAAGVYIIEVECGTEKRRFKAVKN